MSDSRSHAADMEDEDETCKYGFVSKYFDDCKCDGCVKDRAKWERAISYSDSVKYKVLDLLAKTPREEWKYIKVIMVNFE